MDWRPALVIASLSAALGFAVAQVLAPTPASSVVAPDTSGIEQRLEDLERSVDAALRRPPAVTPLDAAPRPLDDATVTERLDQVLERLASLERTAADIGRVESRDAPMGIPIQTTVIHDLYDDWNDDDAGALDDLVGLSADAAYAYLGSPSSAFLPTDPAYDVQWIYAFVDEELAASDEPRDVRWSHKRLHLFFADRRVARATIANAFEW